MSICPKCGNVAREGSKICRQCGAIVIEAQTPPSQGREPGQPTDLVPAGASAPPPSGPSRSFWICIKCGERHDSSFLVCWNCGTDRDGNEDPGFVRQGSEGRLEPASGSEVESPEGAAPSLHAAARELPSPPACKCAKCGSTRVLPDVQIMDQGDGSDGELKAIVYAKPDAIFFKNGLSAEVRANICGDCGHLELRVLHPEELYRHMQL